MTVSDLRELLSGFSNISNYEVLVTNPLGGEHLVVDGVSVQGPRQRFVLTASVPEPDETGAGT